MRHILFGLLVAATTPGCIRNMTPIQRAQDAANDFTTAARFGRMDVALEHVSPQDRERFVKQHASWGSNVRIVDCDIMGVRLAKEDRAEVALSVSWQRVDESEMRVTHLAQKWRDRRGTWLLESEERAAGDVGLLGEPTTVVRPSARPVQFESITIR
jgi:hypothetical protein